jgi:hypothetical protein
MGGRRVPESENEIRMQGTTDTVQWIKVGGAYRYPPSNTTVAISPTLVVTRYYTNHVLTIYNHY